MCVCGSVVASTVHTPTASVMVKDAAPVITPQDFPTLSARDGVCSRVVRMWGACAGVCMFVRHVCVCVFVCV